MGKGLVQRFWFRISALTAAAFLVEAIKPDPSWESCLHLCAASELTRLRASAPDWCPARDRREVDDWHPGENLSSSPGVSPYSANPVQSAHKVPC